MKTYSVELRRTSFITVQVEAHNREHAEEQVLDELESSEPYGVTGDADWQVESIEEQA